MYIQNLLTVSKLNDTIYAVITLKNFMDHDFEIQKITLACFVGAGKGRNVHTERPSHGLAFFVSGERTICFDNKKLTVGPNTVVYFPKGSNYTVFHQEMGDCYAINFQIADHPNMEPFVLKPKNPTSFYERFKTCQKLWNKKSPGYMMKVKAELYTILYELQREYHTDYIKNSHARLQPALDHIHSVYYKESISVSRLAALCNMSQTYLRKLFISQLGLAPVRYINSLKLQRAQELLLSGMYSVTEVCYQAGFNDESHFSREFKKQYSVPPAEYAKSARN